MAKAEVAERSPAPAASAFLTMALGRSDTLLGVPHVLHTSAPLVRRERPGDSFDAQFWKRLAKSGGHVIGSGDEAAEDHRICALGDKRLQDVDHCCKLRIAGFGEPLCLLDELGQRALIRQARGRFDIDGFRFVVVEDLVAETLQIAREAVAQGAGRGGGGRTYAAHKRQSSPKGEAPMVLIRSGGGHDSQTVVEDGVVKALLFCFESVVLLGAFVARE
jgi:hypothetical protein